MKKLSYNDVTKGNPHEVMKTYKMSHQEFQTAVRYHCKDAPRDQIAAFQKEVFNRDKWTKK